MLINYIIDTKNKIYRVMRGNLETIVGAMFAGKTSELLKRILWAKHQNKKIIVIKPSIDDRYSNEKIITHNDLSHQCYAMTDWATTLKKFIFEKKDNQKVQNYSFLVVKTFGPLSKLFTTFAT